MRGTQKAVVVVAAAMVLIGGVIALWQHSVYKRADLVNQYGSTLAGSSGYYDYGGSAGHALAASIGFGIVAGVGALLLLIQWLIYANRSNPGDA